MVKTQKSLPELLQETNKLLYDLLIVTKQTKRTLTMVNTINIVTLIVIAILLMKG